MSDHGGWAILVTIARDATLLDRRRIELVDDDLPGLPHHHEGQMLPIDEAVALVERVRASAESHATRALNELASAVPGISGIALRARQKLPPTVAERITDHRARNVADWVMYRDVLAAAAEAREWHVHWFDAKDVARAAGAALGVESFETFFLAMRKKIGPPWNNDHRIAMAAAIAAGST